MKKIGLGIIAVVLVGLILLWFLGNQRQEIEYKTVKVSMGDIEETVTATGTVNAVTMVQVGTQVSGTIKGIYADFNSEVKKGQLIAQIDPDLIEAQVEQARANILSAKANLAKARAALVDAKRTFERNQELFSRNLIAKSEWETAETDYETANAQVLASESELTRMEAASKSSETNLRYTKISSPVDGIVISRNVDVGQTVAASFQTPTLFTIAQDLTKMRINTNVDEADIGKVKEGQDVEFTVDAYPDVPFKGKVWQIRNAPITVENVVTYDVVVQVDNPELKLKPGMTANVTIVTALKKNALKVPNLALRYKPAQEKTGETSGIGSGRNGAALPKGPGLWILENGKPKRAEVRLGISNGNETEIISGEIREGQEVILASTEKNSKSTNSRPPRGPGFF